MTTRDGFAEVDGTRLYFEISGEGPAVALLHGRGADRRMWAEQIAALAARHTVIAYDLRGFGRSPMGENPYSHGDDLAALLDHLGIEWVAPVGLSLGGGAAVNFAVLHPARLWALVTVDGSLGGFPWSKAFEALLSGLSQVAREQGRAEANRRYGETPLFAGLQARPEAAAILKRHLNEDSGDHWVRKDPGRPLSPPAIERLGSIHAPTLVVVGERDLPDFRRVAETLATGIAGARLEVLEGLGHVPPLEDPERFNRLLIEFLEAARRGS